MRALSRETLALDTADLILSYVGKILSGQEIEWAQDDINAFVKKYGLTDYKDLAFNLAKAIIENISKRNDFVWRVK